MLYGDMTRRLAAVLLCVGLTCGLSGCRRKTVQPLPMPQSTAPVALEPPKTDDKLPMVEAPPVKMPPVPVAAAASKPKRERKKPVKPATPPPAPTQVAAATEPVPEGTAIGALTAGGDANPKSQQEAADLIASIEKRLNALPQATTDEGKAQISKVKNFWKQALDALNSGDAEGAKTLATKAKLLLDDLEKSGV